MALTLLILLAFSSTFLLFDKQEHDEIGSLGWGILLSVSASGIFFTGSFLVNFYSYNEYFSWLLIISLLLLTTFLTRKPCVMKGATLYAFMIFLGMYVSVAYSQMSFIGLSLSQLGGGRSATGDLFTQVVVLAAVGFWGIWFYLWSQGHGSKGFFKKKALYFLVPQVSISAILMIIVGLVAVDDGKYGYIIHNLAAVASMGLFVFLMLLSKKIFKETRKLFSLISYLLPVSIFFVWLPTGLKFLKITQHSPVSVFFMETFAFSMIFIWLVFLSMEINHYKNISTPNRVLQNY